MKDNYGRTIDYIRISVTDRCNLRCAYCMPKTGVQSIPHGEILSLEETLRLCGVFAALGAVRFKVTGGEPLVRKGVVPFIAALKSIPGVEKVTLTTNGVLLEENLPALLEAGLDGVNVSLDTLHPSLFQSLTGSSRHAGVMRGIDKAAAVLPVKLNCVPIGGVNDSELIGIAALAKDQVQAVRFIELMPVGLAAGYAFISAEQILARLEREYGPLTPCDETLGNGPARYYAVQGFRGRIGVINAMSHAFCHACNRIRLTSDGWLKLCLSHEIGANLKEPLRAGASDRELADVIADAISRKPHQHSFHDAATGTAMNSIGG